MLVCEGSLTLRVVSGEDSEKQWNDGPFMLFLSNTGWIFELTALCLYPHALQRGDLSPKHLHRSEDCYLRNEVDARKAQPESSPQQANRYSLNTIALRLQCYSELEERFHESNHRIALS